jgi:uncharacterized protein YebE (UPF0316 family)
MLSTALSTLRSIFIVKGISKPAYLITMVDSMLFMWGTKLVVSGDGFGFIIVFALGKLIGTWVGDMLEKKIAMGTLQVSINAKGKKAIHMADAIREMGYTVNTRKVYGMNGNERFEVCFFVKRKEKEIVLNNLGLLGYKNLSMVITDVNSTDGKIKTNRII